MYLKIEILSTSGVLNLLPPAAVLLESDTVSGTIKEAPSYTQIEVKLSTWVQCLNTYISNF